MIESKPSARNRIKRSSIHICNGKAVFFGQAVDASMHRHYAIQIAIGLEQAFKLKYDDEWYYCRVAVSDANQPHQFVGDGSNIIILIDPETEAGNHLRQTLLIDNKVKILNYDAIESLAAKFDQRINEINSCQETRTLCDAIIYAISGEAGNNLDIEPRIQKALEVLNQSPVKNISTKLLAKSVHLSESRLTHLFKEQVGVPVRRYVLWLRLMEALDLILEGKTFTAAAHEAGFADSAHLSRSFRQMFGVRLSDVFKNDRFVQVIICR